MIKFGEFTISPDGEGGYWIENGIGEQMHVNQEQLEEAIRKFWKDTF